MRRLLLFFLLTFPAFGYQSFSGWCEQGGVRVSVAGQTATTYTQQSYPNFTQSGAGPSVTVYAAGTTNKITLYSDNNATPLGNPFPCTATGQYSFFTAAGTNYVDLLFSGSGVPAFTRSYQGSVDPANLYYKLPATGSVLTTVQTKLNSFYEAVADFGADPTNTGDSTAAFQAMSAASSSSYICGHAQGGTYKISYSSVAAVSFSSNSCMNGDGPFSTVFLLNTSGTNATAFAVTGFGVKLGNFFIGKEPLITGGIGLSIYPVTTSATQAAYGEFDNITINAAFCNNTVGCGVTANSNRLTYGVLMQSGTVDDIFNTFKNLQVRWANEGVYLLSGGLAGSSGLGAVNANTFTAPYISDTTDCFLFGASGENSIKSGSCTDASYAEVTFRSNPNGGTYAAAASSANSIEILGESDAALVDFGTYATGSAGINNVIVSPLGGEDGGSAGNYQVLGSAQFANTVSTPANFSNGYYQINTIASGSYTSGITTVGTTGQSCILSFVGGTGTATLLLTGTNAIAGSTAFTSITAAGTYQTAPTTALVTTGTATSCTGTATVATVLAVSATTVDSFTTNIGDFVNNPATAAIDFSGSSHNPAVMRLRNPIHSALTAYDYYNLTLPFGHVWRDDPVATPITAPVATFQKTYIPSGDSSPASFIRFITGTGSGSFAGDVQCGYLNTVSSAATQCEFGTQNASSVEVYPFSVSQYGAVLQGTIANSLIGAGQVGLGSAVTASSFCGSLSGAAGCWTFSVAGTSHYIPYY